MTQGVTGHFDISGENELTLRVFYSEEYDEKSGIRVVSVTGMSLQSTKYPGTWWPDGTIAIEGKTVYTMTWISPTTHTVTVSHYPDTTGWYSINPVKDSGAFPNNENAYPWASGELKEASDGSKSVTFTVNVVFRNSQGHPASAVSGSHVVKLTRIDRGLIHIDNGTELIPCTIHIDTGTGWVQVIPCIDTGSKWVICA
jgi:hypothetical protein